MKVVEIPISKITENPFQNREGMDKDSLKVLTRSIRERGLFNPITVLKNKEGFTVIHGHRRLIAFKKLRRKTIPGFVKKSQRKNELKIDLVHENLLRDDLTPSERGRAIKQLLFTIKNVKNDLDRAISLINQLKLYKNREKFPEQRRKGFENSDIFRCMKVLKTIGMSENAASNYLSILKLPLYMQRKVTYRADKNEIYSNRINITKAYQLTRVHDIDYRNYLYEKAIQGTCTKVIQALVDRYIEKVNKGEWQTLQRSNQTIWKNTKSDDRLLELSNACQNLSARLESWKLTKLITLSTLMSKELFISSLIDLKKKLRLLDAAIDRRLRDKGYVPIKKEIESFEIEINLQSNKHCHRFTFPMRIHKELRLPNHAFVKLKVVEVRQSALGSSKHHKS